MWCMITSMVHRQSHRDFENSVGCVLKTLTDRGAVVPDTERLPRCRRRPAQLEGVVKTDTLTVNSARCDATSEQ